MAETSFARHGVAPRVVSPVARPRREPTPVVGGSATGRADLAALVRVGGRRAGQMCTEHVSRFERDKRRPSLLRRVFGAGPLSDGEREAFDAARGERLVGAELDKLSPSWIVLHSLPAPGASGDLDHVVVGPAGLFAITTRYVDGERVFVADDYLLTSGLRTPFAREAIAAARRTAQLAGRTLPPSVSARPVLAIAGARAVRVGVRARAVDVRDAAVVRSWLESQPVVLDAYTVERVGARVAAAFEESSRVDLASDSTSAAASETRFRRLEREIAAARRIRSLWRVVGACAVTAGVWVAFAHLPSWLALHVG
ncbi:NERD domain-containing protein [Labedella populi]|uniref:NERD domain-containing protein n=1 Tax=Labedella populi TaxID=2498850 RepID=A0A3S3ZYR9_9MICO|nr:nuclease-related domain-containing protein [Labedella populi]RWZ67844.1 NERD domain-containing protein [Labedella populi]